MCRAITAQASRCRRLDALLVAKYPTVPDVDVGTISCEVGCRLLRSLMLVCRGCVEQNGREPIQLQLWSSIPSGRVSTNCSLGLTNNDTVNGKYLMLPDSGNALTTQPIDTSYGGYVQFEAMLAIADGQLTCSNVPAGSLAGPALAGAVLTLEVNLLSTNDLQGQG